ncbi:hypothetical protein HQ529_02060 [Candidatus Woesearchaeota archaeon]|nr:hypothetical protein [Candidatus Woesearchaeota archaeon]
MKINLTEIGEKNIEHKTPYFLFSKEMIRKQYGKIKEISDRVIYPVKTNPNKKIIDTLESIGSYFFVSSIDELKKIKNKKNAFLSIRSLEKDDIKNALSFGVINFIAESEKNLVNLITVSNKSMNVFLRFRSPFNSSSRYGNNMIHGFDKDEIIKNLKKLKKFGGIKFGLHNHLSSQLTNLSIWKKNLKSIFSLLKILKKQNIKIDFLDLGGGVPIRYAKEALIFEKIKKLFEFYFKKYREVFPKLKIFLEPGRFIAGPSGVLITKIIEVKNKTAIINSSVYTTSMDTLVVGLELPCYTTSMEKEKKNYTIRGKGYCSLDIFRKKVKLNKLSAGDYIIFYNSGAYTFSSDFVDKNKLPLYFE